MNLYEHTIIARQDTSPNEIKLLTEKYSKIVDKNKGEIVKTENCGLINLSYLIKKNKKGNYIHFKIDAEPKVISEFTGLKKGSYPNPLDPLGGQRITPLISPVKQFIIPFLHKMVRTQ